MAVYDEEQKIATEKATSMLLLEELAGTPVSGNRTCVMATGVFVCFPAADLASPALRAGCDSSCAFGEVSAPVCDGDTSVGVRRHQNQWEETYDLVTLPRASVHEVAAQRVVDGGVEVNEGDMFEATHGELEDDLDGDQLDEALQEDEPGTDELDVDGEDRRSTRNRRPFTRTTWADRYLQHVCL